MSARFGSSPPRASIPRRGAQISIFRRLNARLEGVDGDILRDEERRYARFERERGETETVSWRMVCALICAILIYLVIAIKMGVLAFSPPSQAPSRSGHAILQNGRADITDRNGEILATNFPGYSLYGEPHKMVDPDMAIAEILRIFPEMDEASLREKLTDETRKFVWVRQQISPEQRQAIFDLGEPGLKFGARELRLFPSGSLGAHILGWVRFGETDARAAEIKGQAGLEYSFDRFLSEPANRDTPLVTSLDISAQDALEAVLAQAMTLYRARGAAAVLMEADTGRITAMASLPSFDPNQRPKPLPQDANPADDPRFNRAALGLYELGSTFKILTAAQAMEAGIAKPDTMIEIGHSLESGQESIRDHDYYGEELSLQNVIVKSSNIGTARLARALGGRAQREFLGRLGLLEPTVLELPEAAHARPQFPRGKRWNELATMTISFGHGISASPLHLASAYASMVNGGYRVYPTLLNEGWEERKRERVISEETSIAIRKMMRDVVTSPEGTGGLARSDGYDIGGKTGTADKKNPEGGYYEDKNINSFAAAFPMSDPKYVLVVTLDEPRFAGGNSRQRTAAWTAVPVAREIVQRVAPLLNLRPVYSADIPIE